MLPGIEPSPPTMTMANALTIGSSPILGCTVRKGAPAHPPAPAVPAEIAITIENIRLVGIPMYWAASGILRHREDSGAEAGTLDEQPEAAQHDDACNQREKPLAADIDAADADLRPPRTRAHCGIRSRT